jgi:predicted metal-dependent HD superfamily phosphohydrolase
VVALEDVAGDAEPGGEGVQLVVRLVAHEVAPEAAAPRPERVVDQNHGSMVPDVPALRQVAARYDEPHRRYHDRRHLDQVMDDVERLLAVVAVPDPEAVRLAALFHDAVYDPRSATNEADSAFLSAQVLAGLEPPERVADVQRLVLATAGHEPSAADEAVLLDADLAVLGVDRLAYVAYVRAVRLEFAHVADPAWRVGRGAVLRSLLALPRLFSTPPRHQLEPRARENLAFELASLSPG